MENIKKISMLTLVLVLLVASSFLLPQNWFSVAADQGPYPPPETTNNIMAGEPYPPPSLPDQSSAYPPPVEENVPVPTVQPSENESFTKTFISLETEIELRKSIGFRSDTEYVESVRSLDNVVILDKFGGLAFTPNEAKEFEVRLNLEKDGAVLINFFENEPELQDAFGGIYLEHAAGSEDETAGGKLVLQLVNDHDMTNDIPVMLPTLQYPERLSIELVDFPNERLIQQFQAISYVASQHSEIQAVSIDQRNNRVSVMVAPSDTLKTSDGVIEKASLPEGLATLVVDPSIVVWEGDVTERVEAVRGGDSWSNTSGGSDCTLGFKVKYGNAYSMLTAGHCVEELGMSFGDDVYHDTTKIGTWSGPAMNGSTTSNGAGLDAAVLTMNDFGTAYDDVNHYDSYRDIIGSTSDYVSGYWRCWTGKNSGTQCGVINCTSSTYTNEGRWYIDMFTIDPPGVKGDSGAPAYRSETGSKASVTGVKRSSAILSCTNGFDSVFSKWHNIRDFWSLILATDTEVYLPLLLK